MTDRKIKNKIRFLQHQRDQAFQFKQSLEGTDATDYECGRAEGMYQGFSAAYNAVKDLVEEKPQTRPFFKEAGQCMGVGCSNNGDYLTVKKYFLHGNTSQGNYCEDCTKKITPSKIMPKVESWPIENKVLVE